MKKFSPYAIPGELHPVYGMLCVFQTHNDIFFLGVIPNSQSQIFVYANQQWEQKINVKSFQYVNAEQGGLIEIRLAFSDGKNAITIPKD